MTKTLCLDFGNTRLKAAQFVNDEIKEISVLKEDGVDDLSKLLNSFRPDVSILSSVIHHNPEIEQLLATTKFHKLSNHSKLPFTIPVGKPETMGADRLAIAAAAVHLFPEKIILLLVWALALHTISSTGFINF